MTRKLLFGLFAFIGLALLIGTGTTSCTGPAHCPGVASTGNYKPGKSGRTKYKGKSNKRCPGTASTGNYKPKRKKGKPEDGLWSKEMKKAMKKNQSSSNAGESQASND